MKNNSAIQRYLQGNYPNLIGSIIQISKGRSNKNDWHNAIFYFDHITGRIERYSIMNRNFEKEVLSKLSNKVESYKIGKNSFDKISYISFLMFLIKGYLNKDHKLVSSYEDPRVSNIMYLHSTLDQVSQEAIKDLIPIKREYFLHYDKIENPQIFIPNGINIPVIELSMNRFGIDLIHVDKRRNYPEVLLELKSSMNQVKNKTEDDIREAVGKFNDST